MSHEPDRLLVEGNDETSDGSIDVGRWCDVARETLRSEGITEGRLDVIFVDAAPMAELNREHMGHDRPTDVLAFPLDGPAIVHGSGDLAEGPPPHLGDVVICPEVARGQAGEHTGSADAELTLLVVHGVLHVLGHDHALPDETLVMQDRERANLARHGFGHPVPS